MDCSQFPEGIQNDSAGYPRVTERYAELMLRLACLNRTPIAVASGRINRISCEISRSFRSFVIVACWFFVKIDEVTFLAHLH